MGAGVSQPKHLSDIVPEGNDRLRPTTIVKKQPNQEEDKQRYQGVAA